MERELLERYLAEGLSLHQIGERVGKHPTTVAYWLKQHGLKANGHGRFTPRDSGITRESLVRLLDQGYSLRELADALNISVSTVRYWLAKHELNPTGLGRRRMLQEQAKAAGLDRVELECRRHGLTEFVWRRDGWRCLRCRSEDVSDWRRRVKRDLVEAHGGSCRLCGYSSYQGALQFHHLDPETKRFSLSRQGVTRSRAEAEKEANKCVLLCANCHAEVEAGYRSLEPLPD